MAGKLPNTVLTFSLNLTADDKLKVLKVGSWIQEVLEMISCLDSTLQE